jgi:hypothetical protein
MEDLQAALKEALQLIDQAGKDLPNHIEKMKDLKQSEVELIAKAVENLGSITKEANEKMAEFNKIFK